MNKVGLKSLWKRSGQQKPRKLTLMLIPDGASSSRQYRLPFNSLYILGALLAVMVVTTGFLGAGYLTSRVSTGELTQLRVQNNELSKNYESMRWELAELNSKYEDLIEKEIAIRGMFDFPIIDPEQRRLGVGGPSHNVPAITSRAEELAYLTASDLDKLNRLARFEIAKFDEVLSNLDGKKDILDHTPSIRPTRGWLSRGFGMKRNPFTGESQPHRGMDLANHRGTPVIAPADGRVTMAGRNGGMGKMVIINHGNGFVTRFGHLDKIKVSKRDIVKRGDIIGLMGSTGYSTGPHLHYEVIKNGKSVNPLNYIIDANF